MAPGITTPGHGRTPLTAFVVAMRLQVRRLRPCPLLVPLWIGCAAMVGLISPAAHAQASPASPVRLVVPFPPGGRTDCAIRLLAQRLGETLGQPMLVDNRPGGNLFIGVEAVAKAPADGHTLLLTLDVAMTVNPPLFARVPYDPEKDVAPVSLISTQTVWFVANPRRPATTIAEPLAYARANPRKISYGSGAIIGQLTGELFSILTGAGTTYVPFRGSAPALQALLARDS